ncbi:DUF4156 domain-containing protein [Teredinibacter haidensis]|uniref:DUF4156 domain-containing protein n=1 Tax=Teredinibacter haidensis TaxID=2731755 RepID=UPI000948D9D7|nr:DUF4156 domain-containing protein [Teredinibacter haidensis]
MKSTKLIVITAVLALTATSCTWVKPVEGTEAVALVKANAVQNCKKLGKATVSVKGKVGFFNRKAKKVSEELLTLARNEAVSLGADTIVSDSVADAGKQSFSLYQCR